MKGLDEQIQKAKEIFLKYSGSRFQMQRDYVLTTYEQMQVSKEQELEWARERLECLLRALEHQAIDDSVFQETLRLIKNVKDAQGFEKMVSLIDQKKEDLDTFTQIRFAEDLFDLSKYLASDRTMHEFNVSVCEQLLKLALQREVRVHPHYSKLAYLSSLLSPEVLKERAKVDLEEIGVSSNSS